MTSAGFVNEIQKCLTNFFGAVLTLYAKFYRKFLNPSLGGRRATVPLPRRVAFSFMGGGGRSQHRASGPAHTGVGVGG